MSSDRVDVAIVGGGAAGLMCAFTAARRGRKVRVLEHGNRVGRKILMSGGGRCNFTNIHTTPANFLSANPHFCKSALARYTPWDFIALVQKHGIAYHEKELGQLFCDESAKDIVDLLLAECADAGVQIATKTTVGSVTKTADGFRLGICNGEGHGTLDAQSLVIATGGLSIPTMGATGFGYEVARQFGHAVLPTRAALVPFTLTGRTLEQFDGLSGVALPATVECNGVSFSNALLFTHRGLSGPAILQISSYWQPGDLLHIDLLPGTDALAWLQARQRERPETFLHTVLAEALPKRLAQRLCDLGIGGTGSSRPLKQYNLPELKAIAAALNDWQLRPAGTEGWRTAEVTLGGVDTAQLSSATMSSKIVPGLFFVGEVVDVTGQLGGFNFQWAWASGHAAGQVA
ncbi:MAG: NAD(P)/FAD-dependent oxidoreductase [Gammaproteobacteria bacterium]